jgi:hypothetical protein
MSRITEHIDVDVARRVAYDQWTQFESFPQFMEGVERVVQLDDKTLDWTANVGGKTKHWRAEIMEQRPDQLISWRSIEGARNDGTVRFEPLEGDKTRLTLELDVEPEGPIESAGDALGFVSRRAKGDLERFKEFIEGQGRETGGWRGEIEGGRVEDDDRSTMGSTSGSMRAGGASMGSAGGSLGSSGGPSSGTYGTTSGTGSTGGTSSMSGTYASRTGGSSTGDADALGDTDTVDETDLTGTTDTGWGGTGSRRSPEDSGNL